MDKIKDDTLDYFDNEGKCEYCGSGEDNTNQKSRFLHILKYCEKFETGFDKRVNVYKLDT